MSKRLTIELDDENFVRLEALRLLRRRSRRKLVNELIQEAADIPEVRKVIRAARRYQLGIHLVAADG